MSSALIPSLQRALVDAGLVALRFNFRGVGRSQGTYDAGRGEVADARAALGEVAGELPPGAPLAIIGWSFGGLVALWAALGDERVTAAVAIAPPFNAPARIDRPDPPAAEMVRVWPGRTLLVFGTRDRLAPPEGLDEWAEAAGAAFRLVPGADHFFTGRYDHVAKLVTAFLRGTDE